MAAVPYTIRKMPDNATIWERLENRSIPEPNSGCLLWFGSNGGSATSQHGIINYKGRHWKVHRLAWIATHGPIPEGMEVCHKCDVPACINPAHLFLGSHDENMADMVAKGRSNAPRGAESGNAKLTESAVLAIRADRRAQKLIAEDYGVSKSLIWAIKSRQAWRHL